MDELLCGHPESEAVESSETGRMVCLICGKQARTPDGKPLAPPDKDDQHLGEVLEDAVAEVVLPLDDEPLLDAELHLRMNGDSDADTARPEQVEEDGWDEDDGDDIPPEPGNVTMSETAIAMRRYDGPELEGDGPVDDLLAAEDVLVHEPAAVEAGAPPPEDAGPVDQDGTPIPDGRCHGYVYERDTKTYRRCNTLFKRPGSTQTYCKRHLPKPEQMQIPEPVKHALAEVLGRSAVQVEAIWVELLTSKSERIRLDAVKALSSAATSLASRSGPGRGSSVWPQTRAEVEALSWNEVRGGMVGYYADSMQACVERSSSDEEAMDTFIASHGWNRIELELMRKAVQALPPTLDRTPTRIS